MTEITVFHTLRGGESSDSLLRRAASLYTGYPAEEFGTRREPWKKPVFLRHPEIFASVSHTGNLWASAFSRNWEIGLDVQEAVPVRRMEGIANRFFAAGEREAFFAAEDRIDAFFRIWCRKEAAVKQSGRGIDGEFQSVDTEAVPFRAAGIPLVLVSFDLPEYPAVRCAMAAPEEFSVVLRSFSP